MKKAVLLFLGIGLLSVFTFYMLEGEVFEDLKSDIRSDRIKLRIDVPNSDGKIAVLTKGKEYANKRYMGAEFEVDGVHSRGSVIGLVDYLTFANSKSFVLPFYVNYGGSGTFLHLGYFKFNGLKIIHKDSVFIGDRVDVLKILVDDSKEIILEYNDYRKNRAMSTIPDKFMKKVFVVENDKLKLIKH